MGKQKKMGRPPASWMFELIEVKFDKQWTDAYEVSKYFGIRIRTVKSFFYKLHTKAIHTIENGRAKAQFNVKELKEATKLYIEPWL